MRSGPRGGDGVKCAGASVLLQQPAGLTSMGRHQPPGCGRPCNRPEGPGAPSCCVGAAQPGSAPQLVEGQLRGQWSPPVSTPPALPEVLKAPNSHVPYHPLPLPHLLEIPKGLLFSCASDRYARVLSFWEVTLSRFPESWGRGVTLPVLG